MKIFKNKNLKPYNTFGIEEFCDEFVEIENEDDLSQISFQDDFFILGGGSNVLITRRIEQVMHLSLAGVQVVSEDSKQVKLRVKAGTNWDNFVAYCVERGWGGVENLSLIPGSVGAAPVQNIGAYGVEVQDVISKVRYFDIQKQDFFELTANQCRFGYRDSIFKAEFKGRAIITEVEFVLSKVWKPKIRYGGLLNVFLDKTPNILDVRNVVIGIRRKKLPNPQEQGNAGSFFKNPVVNEQKLCELAARYRDDFKYFKAPGGFKVPAAWLIEKAGLKGYRQANAGVSEKHALVLVNYGGATAQEILNVANYVEQKVFEIFGIQLRKEVNVV